MTTAAIADRPRRWEAMYTACRPWIEALARTMAARCRQDPEDVLQQFLLILFKRFPGYRPELSAPTTWIEWQARSLRSSYLRQRPRVGSVSLDALARIVDDRREYPLHDPRGIDAADAAVASEEADEVREALEELAPRVRAVLECRLGIRRGPTSFPKIARLLGMSQVTAHKLERQGLEQVAAALGADPGRVISVARAKGRKVSTSVQREMVAQ